MNRVWRSIPAVNHIMLAGHVMTRPELKEFPSKNPDIQEPSKRLVFKMAARDYTRRSTKCDIWCHVWDWQAEWLAGVDLSQGDGIQVSGKLEHERNFYRIRVIRAYLFPLLPRMDGSSYMIPRVEYDRLIASMGGAGDMHFDPVLVAQCLEDVDKAKKYLPEPEGSVDPDPREV